MKKIFHHSQRMILCLYLVTLCNPVGFIINKNDPLECFVLFPPATPMQDVIDLPENPTWVGASMQLGINKPKSAMLAIVSKLI